MFIKSIQLENFQCYYGDNNLFEFKEGLNLIIGDNGAGKSKLYDAFHWVLYDEVFDSASRKFEKTTKVQNQLISDQAKDLCEIDDYAKTSVTLIVEGSQGKEYVLERTYKSKKKGVNAWHDDEKSELSIFKKSVLVPKLLSDKEEKERVLRRIMPDGIKDYMWFQGEQVDSLIDFKDNNSLTKAINVLSDIKEFDTYKDIAELAESAVFKEFKRNEKTLSEESEKYEDLEKRRTFQEEELRRANIELNIANENMTRAEEKEQEIIGKIEDAGKINTLQERIKSVEQTVTRLGNSLDRKLLSFNKNLFTQKWLLLGLDWTSSFGEKYNNYQRKKIERRAMAQAKLNAERDLEEQLAKPRLPINVPAPTYVKQMLDEERCLVCDREAPKNSAPWEKISELLAVEQATKTKQLTVVSEKPNNDFDNDFNKLYHNGLGLQQTIGNIENMIDEYRSAIKELENERALESRNLEDLRQEVRTLVEHTNIDELKSASIIVEFDMYRKKIQQLVLEKERIEQRIKRAKDALSNIEADTAKLVRGKMPQTLIDKRRLLKDFKTIADSTRERVYNRLIGQLETEANKHYISMTAENKAVRGSIKLVKQNNGTYMPQNLDNNGNKLSSINDSNIILIKLAVIMAIISAKKSSAAPDLYTFITDAPTSKFSENYAIGFCKTVATVYSQSIIMSKDFYYNTDLRKRLIDELGDQLGSMYVIEPSVSETERTNRNTLSVHIQREKF
ncbi:MAG: AAA family ATPase [Sphingobacteriales bacterium]|nr:AAA family ATPase [Sphingobacteriales bacterium]